MKESQNHSNYNPPLYCEGCLQHAPFMNQGNLYERPGRPMPGRPMPGQPMPGQPMPNQPMPGRPMPNQPMPGQPMPGEPMSGQPMPGRPMPNQPMPGRPMPSQPMPVQPMPGQPMPGQPMPYFMAYPGPYMRLQELDDDNDLERMKSMFPKSARIIQPEIEEVCQQMEYEGSMMFDEYPDRVMTEKIVDEIYEKIQKQQIDESAASEMEDSEEEGEVFVTDCNHCRNHDYESMRELIAVMLYEEMFRRRCRRRRKCW